MRVEGALKNLLTTVPVIIKRSSCKEYEVYYKEFRGLQSYKFHHNGFYSSLEWKRHQNVWKEDWRFRLLSCNTFLLLFNQFLREINVSEKFPVQAKIIIPCRRVERGRKACCEDWRNMRRCDTLVPGRLTGLEYRARRNDRHSSAVVNLDCGTSLSLLPSSQNPDRSLLHLRP
jgi:hypothetical protein